MKWSWRLGTVAGIGIYVHWTFLLLIGWVALTRYRQSGSLPATFAEVGFILTIFGCVVLHELGHALAARRYHIPTRDITLLPIGGVARLERMPDDPKQELWITLAGPAVNVAIAGVLGLVIALTIGRPALENVALFAGPFAVRVMAVNVILVVFNLLPAFPMDGGRVLRALLALRLEYVRATRIAATVGQVMAVGFGVLGLMVGNFILIFIALFVFMGAQQEANMVRMRSAFRGVPVREAMIRQFCALGEEEPIEAAVAELLAGSQHDFPVVDGDRVVGILPRRDLVRALAQGAQNRRVGDLMRPDCRTIDELDMVEAAFLRMQEAGCPTLPVVSNGRLVGVLTLETIRELMMINSALSRARSRRDVQDLFNSE